MSQLIRTTEQKGLLALATGGTPVTRLHDQIQRALREQLGEEHARLLAEPNHNPAQGTIDWYCDAAAPVRALSALDAAERAAVKERLYSRVADIGDAAQRFAKSLREADRVLSRILDLVIQIPSEDCVYEAGGEPVLICWGSIHEGTAAERDILRKPRGPAIVSHREAYGEGATALATAAAMPAAGGAVAVPVERLLLVRERVGPWAALLWLLFALLTATLLYMLFSACGIALPFGGPDARLILWDACPGTGVFAAERARTEFLQQELDRLQRQIAETDCTRTTRAGKDDASFDQRVIREGGKSGSAQVTLLWNSDADLDLAVQCPSGETISFYHKNGCNGTLDVDMNYHTHSQTPVENVVWPNGAAPPGHYVVTVSTYDPRSDGGKGTPFRVRVTIDGRTEVVEAVSHGLEQVATFEVK